MTLTKEDIDKVRHVEGFPIAMDEDIITLSNPPYYTACPNPFIEDFIKEHGKPYDETTDDYHREPFAFDVSEGKGDPIYNAHSYHTKVPHKAIMRYILHYTNPGDIVFDGFCGTGMTGVAARLCGDPDPEFKTILNKEMPEVKWGHRKTIINDLSPAATFIAQNYNSANEVDSFEEEAAMVIEKCEEECLWMYKTKHSYDDNRQLTIENENGKTGDINYTVWSDVFICPNCGEEIVFWNVAVDHEKGEINDSFICKNCMVELTKNNCTRATTLIFDSDLKSTVSVAKQVPVLINYTFNGKRYEKAPDEFDYDIIEKINKMNVPYWYPKDELPNGYNTEQPKKSHGITHTQYFYTKRNLIILSTMLDKIKSDILLFVFTGLLTRSSKQARFLSKNYFHGGGGWVGTNLSGTLFVPSLNVEVIPVFTLRNRVESVKKIINSNPNTSVITTQSATCLKNISSDCVDYIFTDPPFGDNLNYSELSFLWESWLKVKTNNKTEAIINKIQGKGLIEYQEMMTQSFKECYRILKPNRWMTVEFHNSKNAVWNSIQEALLRAGFIIADVRTLDKKQGSFKQVTTTSAVKQDLVISAYKPKESFIKEILLHAGSEDTAWDFVRQHLNKLPIVVMKNSKIEIVAERQAYLLFDRMVAYHIMQGIMVPLDASEFYKGLDERFIKRDSMYFLQDQVNEYDNARILSDVESIQMVIYVSDEKSSISWLYQQLELPQTYAELQPKFMKEIRSIEKYEKLPELAVLLEENFLQDDEGKWYIPDVTKSADVIKLREKKLIKEFEEYLNSTGKLKLFRTEAIRVGFAKLWKEKDYSLIVKTAERLPEKVIQEDDKLLMYYDISLSRM